MNLLPWFARLRSGLRAIQHRADEGHCPCPRWSCTSFRWASEGRYRPYPPSDQRVCHRRRWWPLPMSLCCHYAHTAAKAPHRLCASSPGATGLSWGYRDWEGEYGFRWASQSSMQSADISELSEGVPGPFPTDAHRRGTVPVLCPLRECSRIVTAWQRHGRSGGTGRLSA